jgi:phosphoenolpyruvate synthase/pyruvate phosphate dikinase
MPGPLRAEIGALQAAFAARHGAAQPIRARSSTNNEDLPGFNGAGLYDSYTHRPDEGHLESTIKQVFASLWNFRAFEERAFYRIDHMVAAMGVLLHPNEDDEVANGVAYTKNIYDPSWPGFYVNAQVGESLVTNPDPGARPEEFLISRIGEHGEYETQYISRSSLAPAGTPVLKQADIERLVEAMEAIHPHFAGLYGRPDDPSFAMDIEFKIRKDGSLQIKQARPTVD